MCTAPALALLLSTTVTSTAAPLAFSAPPVPTPGIPLPLPPIPINALGYNATLSDTNLEALSWAPNGFVLDYKEPAKGAGNYSLTISKLNLVLSGKYKMVEEKDKKTASGKAVVTVMDTDAKLTIALSAGSNGLPTAAKVSTCNITFGHNLSLHFEENTGTFDPENLTQELVDSFDGWSKITDLLNIGTILGKDISVCDIVIKKYVEGSTKSLTSLLVKLNGTLAPLLRPPNPVVVPATVSQGMINWKDAFADLKWFPLFLLEEALTFAAPLLNKFITKFLDGELHLMHNGTVSMNEMFNFLKVIPNFKNPFPITKSLTGLPLGLSLNVSIDDVLISGLADFNYLALMVPLHDQTLMNSVGMGNFGAVAKGSLKLPSILGHGLVVTKDWKANITMPNAALNFGLNVFVRSGFFQTVTLAQLTKPLCLASGWVPSNFTLDSFGLETDSVQVDVETSGDLGLLDKYVDQTLQFVADGYRDALPAIINHIVGPQSAPAAGKKKGVFETINGLLDKGLGLLGPMAAKACQNATGKDISVTAPFPLPGPDPLDNKTLSPNETYTYKFTIGNTTIHNFTHIAHFVCDVDGAASANAFRLSLGGFGVKIGAEYSILNVNTSAHAHGTTVLSVQDLVLNATITFKDRLMKRPTAASAISIGNLSGTFQDVPGSTFAGDTWLNLLIALFGGWDSVGGLLESEAPKLIDPELTKLLQHLRGATDLALYDALATRCHKSPAVR